MTLSRTFVFIVICAIIACASFIHAAPDSILVNPPTGPIRGHLDVTGTTYEFRGIPYAKAERWEYSQLLDPWSSELDAKVDGVGFPQICALPPHTCPETTDEHAFFLNVYTPVPKSSYASTPRPVMVYLHGGNYYQGFGSGCRLYNGQKYVQLSDVIVVSINYRLGALGYHYDPENNIHGNYGLLDQITALKWVQKNIAAFGGNPELVTVFGQSAGAGSIAALLTSPTARGLIHRAILHSNPFAIPFRTPATAQGWVTTFRKYTNCTDRACLDKLEPSAILEAQAATQTDFTPISADILAAFIPWNPFVDGKIVPAQPIEAMLAGKALDIPILIGTVKDEADVFIYEAFEKPVDGLGYALFLHLLFGDRANRILERFPAVEGDNRDVLSKVGTEFIFRCPTRNVTRAMSQTSVSSSHIYMYHFDHVMSFGPQGWGDQFKVCWNRVCHAGELPFSFRSRTVEDLMPYTDEEKAMSDTIIKYWTNFATSGHPDDGPSANLLEWPSYALTYDSMYLDLNPHTVHNFEDENCNFWDSIGYYL